MPELPTIQGKQAHSWPEVYFANALDRYDVPYYYQYMIGQFRVRGTLVVDFVIRRPFYQPVEIFGEYWHTGQLGADDRLKLSIEARYFGREPIVVWADQLPDQETAHQFVQGNIL